MSRFVSIRGFRGAFIGFLIGALANLGHAPYFIWPAWIFAIAFLMLRLDDARTQDRPMRTAFWRAFFLAFGYFIVGIYWIGLAFIVRGPEFIPAMLFLVSGLGCVLAIFWGLAAILYVKLCGTVRSRICVLVFACLFFIAEYLRGHLFGGFPWNLPGYIFEGGKPVSQIVSFTGIYGLSFYVLVFAGTFALSLQSRMRRMLPLFAALVALVLMYTIGGVRLKNTSVEYVDDVRLRIVHANIPQRDKFDEGKYVDIANYYLDLTASDGLENISHVIWPEGTLPGLILENRSLMAAIRSALNSGSSIAPVFVMQALRAEPDGKAPDPKYFNSAVAITFAPNAPPQFTSYYDKKRLVPFGEFIPGGKAVEVLGGRILSTSLASTSSGDSTSVPDIPGLPPVSIQICYEIIFPGFTPMRISPSGKAPEWILNLSNDSWFGTSTGPKQHANQVRYRAIEEGIPVVRAATGGVSGVIDSYGRELSVLFPGEDGVLDTRLPRQSVKTAYNRYFNHAIFLIICMILTGCRAWVRRSP